MTMHEAEPIGELKRLIDFADSLERSLAGLGFSLWPLGSCAVASLLCAPILRAGFPNLSWAVAVGAYDGHSHAWNEGIAPGSVVIVDLTARQFEPHLPLVAATMSALAPYASTRVLERDHETELRESITSSPSRLGISVGSGVKTMFRDIRSQGQGLGAESTR